VCARFTLRTRPAVWIAELAEAMAYDDSAGWLLNASKATEALSDWHPRYNIAPTQGVWAVCTDEPPSVQVRRLRWGLIPAWADDLSIGQRMINARSETIASKPAFRDAFRSRRCVLPADGYLEWTSGPDGKQAHLIERHDQQPFYLAGLWERNRKVTADGEPITSFTVATTTANQATAALHDRMPVLLDADGAARWVTHRGGLELLSPAPEDWLTSTPVSRRVNSPRHDDADCLRPRDDPQSLF